MLILRNFLITILLLLLAAISIVGIMVEFPQVMQWTPERINELGRSVIRVMRPGMLLFFVWWFILIASLLVFFLTIGRSRRRMKIEVQMGGGRVVIMDAAIKKYIRSALSEIDDVHVKKIELREHRNQVTTDIYADVRTKDSLPVLERRIISRVRTALAEDLGITNLGDVHVFIKNFEVTGRPITPAPAPADQPEDSNLSEESQAGTGELDDTTSTTTEHQADAPPLVATTESPYDNSRPEPADVEPVIGGETAAEAEHHIDTQRSPLDQAEESLTHSEAEMPAGITRATPDQDEVPVIDTSDSAPVITETSAAEPVDLDDKPGLTQDEGISLARDNDNADHKDLDDHELPWERRLRESDGDDNTGGTRN